jgi:hypothetical protein
MQESTPVAGCIDPRPDSEGKMRVERKLGQFTDDGQGKWAPFNLQRPAGHFAAIPWRFSMAWAFYLEPQFKYAD